MIPTRTLAPAPLVLLAAALCGAGALVAEVSWVQGLARGVGTTPEAFATVAGLFLAGLGLGAAVAARRAPRSERPARAAASSLLALGLLVALSPLYVDVVPDLHVGLLEAGGAEAGGSVWLVVLLGLPLVVPGAFLAGFAFPYLVRARVRDLGHAAGRTGVVYAANTAGALLGVAAAPLLLPAAGETMTLRFGGIAALGAALALLLSDRPLPHGSAPPEEAAPGRGVDARLAGPALCASGAAALIAQMAWFRILGPLAGAHAWGVPFVLGPVLLAIALGAGLGGVLADRVRRPDIALSLTLVLAGVLTTVSLPVAGGLPLHFMQAAAAGEENRLGLLLLGFARTTGPAMLLFGAALPLAVRVRSDWTGRAAGPAGRIYAWNSFGALGGSLLAGFVLLPALGAERSLLCAAALVIVAATALRAFGQGGRRLPSAALHVLPLALLLWPGLLPSLLGSGPTLPEVMAARRAPAAGVHLRDRDDLHLYATWFAGQPARAPGSAAAGTLPAFEGRAGRIELIEEPDGSVGIRRGLLREAVFAPDRPDEPSQTESLLALLPALFRPEAKRALVIGHGAGWTAEMALAAGVGSLDVAEIDEAVLAAARAYRGVERLPVEAAEAARLVRADGRVLLRRAARRADGERYDWIASQPSHPWSVAASHLFTREAYASARGALNPGGVMAQWLSVSYFSPDLLREALSTFRAAFPHAWVFRAPGEIVMLGFLSPPRVDVASWEGRLASDSAFGRAARAAGFDTAGDVWKHVALDEAALGRALGRVTATLSDDVPRLAFVLAERRLDGSDPREAEGVLLEGFPPDMAAILPDSGVRERWIGDAVLGWLKVGRVGDAETWSRTLRWGGSVDGKVAQARSAAAAGDAARARDLLARAAREAPERGDVAARWIDAIAADALPHGPKKAEALAAIREIAGAHPEDGRVLAAAARAVRLTGEAAPTQDLLERALRAKGAPAPPGTRIQFARLLVALSLDPDAEERARVMLANDPATYERIDALDILLRLTDDDEEARTVEKALRSLQRVRGLALWRGAAQRLARHDMSGALGEARRCQEVWSWNAAAHELAGLASLMTMAARRAADSAWEGDPSDAILDLKRGVKLSEDPPAALRRGQRYLAWFGLPTSSLQPKAGSGGEDRAP